MKLKKLVAITLSAVMCMAALTGCGGKSDSAKKTAKVIEVDLTDEQYAFGVDKDQPDLLKEVNQFVKDNVIATNFLSFIIFYFLSSHLRFNIASCDKKCNERRVFFAIQYIFMYKKLIFL